MYSFLYAQKSFKMSSLLKAVIGLRGWGKSLACGNCLSIQTISSHWSNL